MTDGRKSLKGQAGLAACTARMPPGTRGGVASTAGGKRRGGVAGDLRAQAEHARPRALSEPLAGFVRGSVLPGTLTARAVPSLISSDSLSGEESHQPDAVVDDYEQQLEIELENARHMLGDDF